MQQVRRSGYVQRFERNAAGRFGTPLWDHAVLATYYDSDTQALVVPLENGDSSDIRVLLTPYSERTGAGWTLIFVISPAPAMIAEYERGGRSGGVPFSGVLSYYTPDGELLTSATFDRDQLVSTRRGDVAESGGRGRGLQARSRDYWGCLGDCIAYFWDSLPFYLKILCNSGCGSCALTGHPIGCAVCAACLSTYAVNCSVFCRTYGYWPL